MSVILTRKVHFCASHREHNPALSDDENRRLFGKCNNTHGHNYLCEVSVEGEIDPQTGLVIDLKALSELLDEVVMRRYDHRNLSVDIPDIFHPVTSTEVLAVDIWNQVAPRLVGCHLHRIRLYESATLFVDYYGGR